MLDNNGVPMVFNGSMRGFQPLGLGSNPSGRSTPPHHFAEGILSVKIEDYIHLVKQVARSMKRHLPPQVDVEDLESAGYLGLLDAAKKFDETRNVKFSTYCTTRIRGAIGDELRRVDWVPRLVRQSGEPAVYMSLFSDISSMTGTPDNNDFINPDFVVADNSPDIVREIDIRTRIHDAINQLKPKYKQAVMLYYFDGHTLKEAAKFMGTTESRVCQILKKVRPILKRILKEK